MSNNPDVLLTAEVIEAIKKLVKEEKNNYTLHSGLGNEQQKVITTDYLQTANEVVLKGKTNSLIVLGSDRPAGVNSGYGGVGHTACASIDLIAGHSGRRPVRDIKGIVQKTSKNFEADAARVYISQYCDLDDYFGIPNHFVGAGDVLFPIQQSRARSGVGIKADVVRIYGTENIKIVTKHVAVSTIGQSANRGGIDIIAGVDNLAPNAQPQPMVKGDNLIAFLTILSDAIIDVQSNLSNFIKLQQEINLILSTHRHQVPLLGITDSPLETGKMTAASLAITKEKANHIKVNVKNEIEKHKFFAAESPEYINSLYNRVN
jgi:hypothetical protein